MAGLMAGADGCLLEVHESPEQALSDGAQTLSFAEAEALFRQLERLHEAREQLRLA
jgi:3-deoxy-7-phosphoheptulonate synthase